MDRSHLRFFTRRTLTGLMQEAGYRVLQVDVTVPLPALRRPPFNAWAHWAGLRWKSLVAYQFIVIADPLSPSPDVVRVPAGESTG
jgi:hypothetical protein